MRATFTFDDPPTEYALHLSTEHSASSYGVPVVVNKAGEAIDRTSWAFYRVTEATDEEVEAFAAAGYPVTWADDPGPVRIMFDEGLCERLYAAIFGTEPGDDERERFAWLRAALQDLESVRDLPRGRGDLRAGVVEAVVATLSKLKFARVEFGDPA